MAGVELATAYVNLVSSAQGLGGAITGELTRAGSTGGEAGGRAAGKSFGGALVKFGAIGGAGVAAVGAGLFKVGATFDDVSDTIRTGTGATGKSLDSLVGIAKSVGTSVPASFDKVGSTVADLNTRLGLTGGTLSTVSKQYLEAGRILGEDVDISKTSAAFTAFGISGDGVSKAMDTLFQVSQATGVSINDLSASVSAQAPALKTLGFSFDQTAVLAGSLDKAGLNSTATLAALGKGLTTLAKSGKDPKKAFEETTAQITQFVKEGKTAEAITTAGKIFGTKGANQFVGAIQSGKLNLQDLNKAAGQTSDTILGVGKETADAAESFKILKNKALVALDPIGSAIFNGVGKALSGLVDNVGKVGPAFAKLSKSSPGIAAATGAVKSLSGAFAVITKGNFDPKQFAPGIEEDSPFVNALFTIREGAQKIGETVGGVFSAAWQAIAPILQQVGAILGPAIASVFATLAPIFSQLGPIVAQLLPVFNPFSLLFHALLPILPQIAAVLGQVAQVLAGAISQAFTAVQPLLTTLVGVFNMLLPIITNLIASLLPPLISLFQAVVPALTAILGAIAPVVATLASVLIPVINALMPVVQTVFAFIASTIANAMRYVQGIIQIVTGILSGNWSKVWEGIRNVIGAVWAQITNIVGSALSVLTGILGAAWAVIKGAVQVAWSAIASTLGGVWGGIKSAASAAFGLVKSYIITPLQAVVSFVGGTFKSVGSVFVGIWSGVKSTAKAAFDLVKKYIIDPLQAVVTFISGTFSGIGDTFSSLWSGIVSSASSILGGIGSAVSGAFSGIASIVKAPINAVISLVNWAIDQLNGISVDIPSWIPVVGGQHFGLSIGHIPSLAAGGVMDPVPGGRIVRVAEAGQREIVTPEPLMRSVLLDTLAETRGRRDGPLIGNVYQQPGQSPWELARDLDRQLIFANG